MFCKNCSKELLENETVCSQCRAPKGAGSNYCYNCGTYTPPNSTYCPRCGAPCKQEEKEVQETVNVAPVYNQPVLRKPIAQHAKSRLAVGVLALLFGALGVHNLYLGNKGQGYAQLTLTLVSVFTCGITAVVSAIWSFVEAIQIFSGAINSDAYGNEFKS
ncbi:MAG: NINE protein [Clostridia bacterium]|nr:NINE protein [Clostridia bacterium]